MVLGRLLKNRELKNTVSEKVEDFMTPLEPWGRPCVLWGNRPGADLLQPRLQSLPSLWFCLPFICLNK